MAFLASGGASDTVFDIGMDSPVWQQRQLPWLFSSMRAAGYSSFEMSCSFTKQVTQHVLLRSWKETTAYKNDVYLSPNRSS